MKENDYEKKNEGITGRPKKDLGRMCSKNVVAMHRGATVTRLFLMGF